MDSHWKTLPALNRATVDAVKEKIVRVLLRWKKQIAAGLMILALLLLLTVINKLVPNNCAWLEGNWSNGAASYTFKAGSEDFSSWTIKNNARLALKHGKVAVNSTKKRIVVTDDGNHVEYHAIRTGRKQLRLKIIRDGKSAGSLELKKK